MTTTLRASAPLCLLPCLLALPVVGVAAAPAGMTRVEGTVTMREAVRDEYYGTVIGSRPPSVPERAVLRIDGKIFTMTSGRYEVDLPPGSYPYFAETTRKVKPLRTREITERYWAMGAVRIEPQAPAAMTLDLELALVEDSQAFCRNCHPDVQVRLGQVRSCHHSTGKPLKEFYKKPFANSGLALEGDLVVCITCHTTHLSVGNEKFLRRTTDRNQLCVQCHV